MVLELIETTKISKIVYLTKLAKPRLTNNMKATKIDNLLFEDIYSSFCRNFINRLLGYLSPLEKSLIQAN